MRKKHVWTAFGVVGLASVMVGVGLHAAEFTDKDVERWYGEYMTVVEQGRELWVSPELGTNGVACAQCHPNAADTHPTPRPTRSSSNSSAG
jgi:thiosulfate dehydrogenase